MPNQQNKANLIPFPGMIEKMTNRAYEAAELGKYQEANELFEQVLLYEHGDEYLLSVYAHSLYVSNDLLKAKQIAEQLLDLKPKFFVEAMELYLTICIHLKEYQQVDKLIETLLNDEAFSINEKARLEKIKDINDQLMIKSEYEEDEDEWEPTFELDEEKFLQSSTTEQLLQVQQLAEINIRPFKETLKRGIEHEEIHPFIKSLLLIILVEQEVDITITIQKLGYEETVNPSDMLLPTMMPDYQRVSTLLEERYESNPTALEMAIQLLTKHAIVAYPFEWKPYSPQEVADGYAQIINEMFGERVLDECAIMGLIHLLENLSELQ